MNGVARKSCKQEPVLERACPLPSAPAAVCCKDGEKLKLLQKEERKLSIHSQLYHCLTLKNKETAHKTDLIGKQKMKNDKHWFMQMTQNKSYHDKTVTKPYT